MTTRFELLVERRTGIGGSDVAAIVGLDPWRTALDVYLEKTVIDTLPPRPTPLQEFGLELEPIIRRRFVKHSNRRVKRARLHRHADYTWMICHPDGLIQASRHPRWRMSPQHNPGVLECKTAGLRVFQRMKREGIPEHYILQMQHNLAVTGLLWGAFAVLQRETGEFFWVAVEADSALQAQLIELEREFWEKHVVARIPPPQVTEPRVALPPVEGEVMRRDDPEWAAAIARLREARELRESAETLEAAANERVQELMGQYGVAEGAGARVYWRLREGRVTFDRQALERVRPLDQFKVVSFLAAQGIAPSVIEDWLRREKPELDLSQFEKQGKPFAEFRFYELKSTPTGGRT